MSKKLMPTSRARRRIGTESGSSSTQLFQAELPIDMVPRQSCDTLRSVCPNWMYSMRSSVVPAGRLDRILEECGAVADPELRVLLLQEPLDHLPRSRSARALFLLRHTAQRPLLGVVIEISRDHDAACFRELHVECLMPRGVPGRKLENHSAVAEYVVIAVEHHRAGMGERRVERHVRAIRVGAERSEEHTSELQSPCNLVCRLLLE